MITQAFSSGEELRRYCREQGITIAEAMQRREEHLSEMSREEIRAEMYKNLVVMRESVYKGLSEKVESVSSIEHLASILSSLSRCKPANNASHRRIGMNNIVIPIINNPFKSLVSG